MKKLLSLILVLSMLLAVSATAFATELTFKTSDPSLFPVADGAEIDVWCGQDGNVANYDESMMNPVLEELTGVHINWTTAPGTQADMNVMLNLHIASGNYADTYLNGFSTADVIEYANDVFIPLDEYIENTRWIKQYLEDMPEIREAITAPDGHIYTLWGGLPQVGIKNQDANPYKLWIYKPWLEKAGMEMPTTIDELREFLRYVRDNDMNGNGDTTDEVPMMGSYAFDHDGSDPTYAFMQAFQLVPSSFLWADEEQNISCVAITDDFREGLKYLNSMYEEGLIPEEIYALTLNEYRDNYTNTTSAESHLVGVGAAPYWWRLLNPGIFGDRCFEEYTHVPVLAKDENSEPQTYTRKQAIGLHGVITPACEDPQLVIDWIDANMDPEVNMVTLNGIEDVHWFRTSEDGALPIIYADNAENDLMDGGTQNKYTYGGWPFPDLPSSYYDAVLEEGTQAYLQQTTQELANADYAQYGVGDYMPATAWCTDSDLLTEKAELQANIETAISNAYAEFILGRRDVDDDAAWEAYKAELEELGLARYLEVVKEINFGA